MTTSPLPQHWLMYFRGTISMYRALMLHPFTEQYNTQKDTEWTDTVSVKTPQERCLTKFWTINEIEANNPHSVQINGIPHQVKYLCLFMGSNPSSGRNSDSKDSKWLVNLRSTPLREPDDSLNDGSSEDRTTSQDDFQLLAAKILIQHQLMTFLVMVHLRKKLIFFSSKDYLSKEICSWLYFLWLGVLWKIPLE